MTTAVMDRTVDTFANQTYDIPPELELLVGECIQFGADLSDLDLEELATVVADTEKLKAMERKVHSHGIFRIMSPKDGDKRVVWCRRVIAQIHAAKKMFLDLIKQGMVPYVVGTDGKASSQEMKEFDPFAEEVIFLPIRAVSGG